MLRRSIFDSYQQYLNTNRNHQELAMFAKTRTVAVISALLLSAFAGAASASDNIARLEAGECSIPTYRTAWQDEEVQGTVKLAVLVGTDGRVQDVKVVESSGYSALDKASLRAGITCKFEPASKDSASAAVWAKVQYKWVLN
jgi:protein TonB